MRKIDSDYNSIGGKSFTIYKGTNTAAFKPKGETNALSGLHSETSGVFWVGELPYGWYIIEETDPHTYFYLVVTAKGVFEGPDGPGGTGSKTDAQTAAAASYVANK